jgi:hypothetical protein
VIITPIWQPRSSAMQTAVAPRLAWKAQAKKTPRLCSNDASAGSHRSGRGPSDRSQDPNRQSWIGPPVEDQDRKSRENSCSFVTPSPLRVRKRAISSARPSASGGSFSSLRAIKLWYFLDAERSDFRGKFTQGRDQAVHFFCVVVIHEPDAQHAVLRRGSVVGSTDWMCCIDRLSWQRLPDVSREPGCVCDESTQCPRAAKYVERRTGCVVGNCCPENRAALIPVCQKPIPEISAFAGSVNCSPSTADQ